MRKIFYRSGVTGGRELQDGVYSFKIFDKATAALLIDAIEAWSGHKERKDGHKKDRHERMGVWSHLKDSADDDIELQANLFARHRPSDVMETMSLGQLMRAQTEYGLVEELGFLLPLVQEVWKNTLIPHLTGKHGLGTDALGRLDTPLQDVFVRKYKAGTGRSKIRGHLDQSIFTFNLALSDQDEVEGGQLFVCKKAPEGYNWLFHGAEGLIHNPIDAMLTFRDLVLDKAFGALKWFDFHHNPKRIQANMDGKDLCKVAQPDAGEALFHHGNRNHGVLPTTAGTRYSMIFFIKRCYQSLDCMMQRPDYVEKTSSRVVANLPREDVGMWLQGTKNAMLGAKRDGIEYRMVLEHMFRFLRIEEYIWALDLYRDDLPLAEMALFAAFSMVAKGGPFDTLVDVVSPPASEKFGDGDVVMAQVDARAWYITKLRGMPDAVAILGRVVALYAASHRQVAQEACTIAKEGGFKPPECDKVRAVRYRARKKKHSYLANTEIHHRHQACRSQAPTTWKKGEPLPVGCMELLQHLQPDPKGTAEYLAARRKKSNSANSPYVGGWGGAAKEL